MGNDGSGATMRPFHWPFQPRFHPQPHPPLPQPALLRMTAPRHFIAPSILSADFARLGEEVRNVLAAGADWIHFDVMDALAAAFARAGAATISFHPEASAHPHRSVQAIRAAGCRPGLAFNPATPLDVLDWLIDDIDLILIMSVNPGFGGQSFIDSALRKTEQARRRIEQSGRDIRLQVDGGIKPANIRRVADAGADTFVAGSAIFGQSDYAQTIAAMRQALA